MKKYNLSKIMKRAWELVKKSALTISSGLKKAWEEAKTMEQKLVELVGSPKQIAWAEDIRKNMISYYLLSLENTKLKTDLLAQKKELKIWRFLATSKKLHGLSKIAVMPYILQIMIQTI